MSGNSKAGASSRSFKIVVAATIAVAMMLAVPLFTAFESEAKFSDREAGYSVTMDNPTDADLTKFGIDKNFQIVDVSGYFIKLFNMDPYGGSPTVTSGSFKYVDATGIRYESNSSRFITSTSVDARDVTITYTATSDDDLIDDYTTYWYPDFKAAGDAVTSYFGSKVYAGDTLTFKGNVKFAESDETKMTYADVNDTAVVAKEGTNTRYIVTDMDVTITLKHGADSKSIKFTSSYKFEFDREITYDYNGVAYSDLTDTSPCTTKYGIDKYSFESGSSDYEVDGKDYSVKVYVPSASDVPGYAKLRTDSDAATDVGLVQAHVNLIPDSTANVTVKKTYSDADSAFADVALDVVGDDVLKIILTVVGIVLGLILLIVIIVIVIIVVKKKKKQQ